MKRYRPWHQLSYEEKLAKQAREPELDARRTKDVPDCLLAPRREELPDATTLPDLFFEPQVSMLDDAKLDDLVDDPALLAEMKTEDLKWALHDEIKSLTEEMEANEVFLRQLRARAKTSTSNNGASAEMEAREELPEAQTNIEMEDKTKS